MSDYWCENCDDTTIAHITDNGARCRLCGNSCEDAAHVIRCLKINHIAIAITMDGLKNKQKITKNLANSRLKTLKNTRKVLQVEREKYSNLAYAYEKVDFLLRAAPTPAMIEAGMTACEGKLYPACMRIGPRSMLRDQFQAMQLARDKTDENV